MNNSEIEIEALLIGYVIQNPSAWDNADLLSVDFSSVEHQTYWRCIESVVSKGENLNPFTVKDAFLAETGSTQEIILDLCAGARQVPEVAIKSYVTKIKQASLIRKAYAISSALHDKLSLKDTSGIDEAITALMNLEGSERNYEHTFSEVTTMVCDEAEKALQGDSGAVKTGFDCLDSGLGGWHPGDLYIIAARPAMGKTAFMINSALGANEKVLIISGEQGVAQMGVRMACINGSINHGKFRAGEMDDTDWGRLSNACMQLKEQDGVIYDKPAPTMLDIERLARKYVYKYGIKAIYVDYAQRINHENNRISRFDKMSDIAQRLKELARSLSVPVVALAQVNRECEKRPDKRPMVSDIADASAFEKEADGVVILYRDEVYHEDTTSKGVIEANIGKNRHGPTGTLCLKWEGQYMKVSDLSDYEASQSECYQSDGYLDNYGG